jgi:hypothetical protein|tara:strand:- start:407 stop:640 length:234 start_codon:yes stop_codon:yes gene_type:complete
VVALRQKHLWLSGKSIAAKHIQRYCLQAVIEHELKTQTQPLLALMVCPYFSPVFLLFPYQFFAYFGGFSLENTPLKR